jgi:hypothetical protein
VVKIIYVLVCRATLLPNPCPRRTSSAIALKFPKDGARNASRGRLFISRNGPISIIGKLM